MLLLLIHVFQLFLNLLLWDSFATTHIFFGIHLHHYVLSVLIHELALCIFLIALAPASIASV